ncbi:MAG: sensor histidine kinase [Alphaproteobacteria bacterium]|nr:sensor histidine kinase [Alphaproteobacteria bacterium]MBV8411494.1 sensor histidine kinase [Alphaproteobacteria bacterium]
MGALMRTFDWSKTPLGDPAGWPDPLKMAVATCLASRFPMVVWWGPELLMLYNDAWQPILGDTKHPAGLGRPGKESWPETWPIVGVQFENALRGEASWSENLLLASDRHGYLEECYFTYSHSPLRDSSGAVRGVLTAVAETTASVLTQRRLRTLQALSNDAVAAAASQRSLAECCRDLVETLCGGNPDVSFALLYLRHHGAIAKLAASAGIEDHPFRLEVEVGAEQSFGLGQALLPGASPIVVPAPRDIPLPGGAWAEPTAELVAVSVTSVEAPAEPLGALLVGANARLRVNHDYLDYLKLAAAQCAASIAALQGIEREKAAAQVNALLVRELNHRSRNLLAVVASISERTRQTSPSLDAYGRSFIDRLQALSRAQGLLTAGEESVVSIEQVVALELATLADGDRARVDSGGPSARLPPSGVQVLSLALHELLTNAIKHGAMRDPGGTLSIRWSRQEAPDAPDTLRIEWRETCSAPLPATAADSPGFGRTMLERVLPAQLSAKTRYERQLDGVRWTIDIPLAQG